MIGIVLAMSLQASSFDAAVAEFSGCLKATVQMGMITKMDPAVFQEGLAKSCKAEEVRFRAEALKRATELGRTDAEAVKEVDGNIANARRIYAEDQATYIRTGKVPR